MVFLVPPSTIFYFNVIINIYFKPIKTIKQWLEELPEPYRTQALENYQDFFYQDEEPINYISDAINWAFRWESSKEGYDYWFNFWEKLSKNNLVDKE